VIGFHLTADGVTHDNQCYQLLDFGGADFEIIVDAPNRSIQIGVTGTHSGSCPEIAAPVNGLEGSVGPLAAGDWEIKTSFPNASSPSEPFAFTVARTSVLLGDVNRDKIVEFSDIASFIAVLHSGEFQAEADCNQDGVVDFLDIQVFIEILSGI